METDLNVSRDNFIVSLTGHIITWGYVALDVPCEGVSREV